MVTKSSSEILTTGRRKESSAGIKFVPGTGKSMKVNGKPLDNYFPSESVRGYILQPMAMTDTVGKFDVVANIKGGGTMGQAGALRHAISRALVEYDESMRPILRDCGMLTRDPRVKERKKPGQPGARKRFQFSKR